MNSDLRCSELSIQLILLPVQSSELALRLTELSATLTELSKPNIFMPRTRGLKQTFCGLPESPLGGQTSPESADLRTNNGHDIKELAMNV